MPTFDTPEPITAELTLIAGNLQVIAGNGPETTVEVSPRVAHKDVDVRAAELVEIDCSGGRLEVRDPQPSGLGRVVGRKGMVDITVELPAGSRVNATGSFGNIRCAGSLGASRISVSNGSITVDRVAGSTELTTGHGSIRAEEVDGAATVKTTTGAVTLGTVTGELTARSAHGDITAERVLGPVTARTSYGSIRIGLAVTGSVDLESSYGELEVGIAEGTAAWLDAFSKKGVVRSSLEAAQAPEPTEETIEVRARSVHGDVLVHRA